MGVSGVQNWPNYPDVGENADKESRVVEAVYLSGLLRVGRKSLGG